MSGDGDELEFRFSAEFADTSSYKLIELPADLLKLVTTNPSEAGLVIKGAPDADAVLCTSNATYAVRSVALSNLVLVVSPDTTVDSNNTLALRDELHELLEVTSTVPRLHRLTTLLKGMEYDEGVEEDEEDGPPRGVPYETVRGEIQASDAELARGLTERHILTLNGRLRPIAPDYLSRILELLLGLLVSLGLDASAAPLEDLVASLQDEHDVRREVCEQVVRWYGTVDEASHTWKIDVENVVRQIGLGVLRTQRREPIAEDAFLAKWHTAVGDTFVAVVSLPLLSGNFLLAPPPPSILTSASQLITYFPASELSMDPPTRFGELFAARPRWTTNEIEPFLRGVAPERKDRERLLIKYARTVPEAGGVVYTARAGFGG